MMRSNLRVILALGLSFAASAPALIVLDQEGGEIIVATRAAAAYDSNIFTNGDGTSDLIFNLKPLAKFRRTGGLLELDAQAGVDFGLYLDNSDQNYQDLNAGFTLSYPNGIESRFYSTFSANYDQTTIPDAVVGDILRLDSTSVVLTGRYRFNEKLSLRGQVDFLDRSYDGSDLANGMSRTGGRLDGIWSYSDKLDLYAGYRFRDISTDGIFDLGGNSNMLLVGAKGSLSPKVVGIIEAGYQNRSFSAGVSDQSEPYFDIGLSWSVSERLIVSLDLIQDFDLASNNFLVNPLSVSLEGAYDWYEKLTSTVAVEYYDFQYVGLLEGRGDEMIRLRAGLDYRVSDSQSLDISLSYSDRSSSVGSANFERFMLGFGYTLIY